MKPNIDPKVVKSTHIPVLSYLSEILNIHEKLRTIQFNYF